MWDLSSPTRDQTPAPCSGKVESYPLDHQGSPKHTDLVHVLLGLYPSISFSGAIVLLLFKFFVSSCSFMEV